MFRTLLLTVLALPLAVSAWAGSITSAPTVIEMFTSKNCPSCPAGERALEAWAAEHPTPLVIFSHVDYWDAHALKPDPLSLAEATQRQYDYSNLLGRRPGEVFTPQPIINGRTMVKPSLRFNFPKAAEAEMATPLPRLVVTQSGNSYAISLPAKTSGDKSTVWLLGLNKDEKHPVYHLRGLSEKEIGSATILNLPPEQLPAGDHVLVLLQDIGPGPVTASALITK